MSFRLPTCVRGHTIQAVSEIRNERYPLDLTMRGQNTLLDNMRELEERWGRYSQDDTQALVDSLESFEPTEEEIQDMYEKADMEGMEILSHR